MRKEKNHQLLVVVAIICAVFISIFKVVTYDHEGYNENLSYGKYRICYEEVNIRKGPDTNTEIIESLTLGSYIELSGKTYHYPLRDLNAMWLETSDGNWIVADAVMDSLDYQYHFGY